MEYAIAIQTKNSDGQSINMKMTNSMTCIWQAINVLILKSLESWTKQFNGKVLLHKYSRHLISPYWGRVLLGWLDGGPAGVSCGGGVCSGWNGTRHHAPLQGGQLPAGTVQVQWGGSVVTWICEMRNRMENFVICCFLCRLINWKVYISSQIIFRFSCSLNPCIIKIIKLWKLSYYCYCFL